MISTRLELTETGILVKKMAITHRCSTCRTALIGGQTAPRQNMCQVPSVVVVQNANPTCFRNAKQPGFKANVCGSAVPAKMERRYHWMLRYVPGYISIALHAMQAE